MQIATSKRANKPAIEVSLTLAEHEKFFGPSVHEEQHIEVQGDVKTGIVLKRTTATNRRHSHLVKILEPGPRQRYHSRFWLNCKRFGFRDDPMGSLHLTVEIIEGSQIKWPSIFDNWRDPKFTGFSTVEAAQPTPLTATVEEHEEAKANGHALAAMTPSVPVPSPPPVTVPRSEDRNAIGEGSGKMMGRAYGIARELNRIKDKLGDKMRFEIAPNGMLIVLRAFRSWEEEK